MAVDGMIGEISVYSFDFAPKSWQVCNGQLLDVKTNQPIFAIIGNKFGGDGVTKFALPDLRGRVPLHFNQEIGIGKTGGEENHTLTTAEMPTHNHAVYGSNAAANLGNPANNFWASNTGQTPYSNQPDTQMAKKSIGLSGGNQGHENMSPFLALNFGICLNGIFKEREGTLGEIIMYAGDTVPNADWMFCNGEILLISGHTALFSILGTYYGGNGTSNFALPNFQATAPMQCGQGVGLSNRQLGIRGGSPTASVNMNQMASHSHQAAATTAASSTTDPTNAIWATGGQVRGGVPFYADGGTENSMHSGAISVTGNEQPHNNMPPYLGLNFMICVNGIYPVRP